MIVMKFGGSSVASSERMKNVAKIIRLNLGKKPIVVISGLGGVTDDLIEAATAAKSGNISGMDRIIKRHEEVIAELELDKSIVENETWEFRKEIAKISRIKELTQKELDRVMSLGERMSVRILSAHMNAVGLYATPYDAYDVGMLTDSSFGSADVLPEAYQKIGNFFRKSNEIPIVTGFIGKDKKGEITTLGRGGSDYTACIIGAAIDAEEIQIWTNVNGIMTADPRIVSKAMNLRAVSYEEESELEFLGANTLHPKGIQPAVKKNIKVRILNTLRPEQNGTLITSEIKEKKRVASITHKEKIQVINIHNPRVLPTKDFTRRVFEIFRKHNLVFDISSASRAGVMVTLNGNQDIGEALKDLKKLGKVEVKSNRAKVSVVGKSLSLIPMISGRMLSSLDGIGVEAISLGGSETSQSFVVKEKDAPKAIRLLHNEFFGR